MGSRFRRYPWGGSAYLKILLIGGLLLYYERFILLPGVFVMGYLIRVLRTTDAQPGFENWVELVIDGLKAELIRFSYLVVIPGSVIVLLADGIVEQGRAMEVMVGFIFEPYTHLITVAGYLVEFAGFGTDGPAQVISLEPILVFFLMIYLYPAAMQAFAEEERLAASFAPSQIRATVTEPQYLYNWLQFVTFWLASIVVLSVPFYYGTDIARFLVLLFGVGFIENLLGELVVVLAGFLGFYLLVGAYYLLGSTENIDIRTPLESIFPTRSALSTVRSLSTSPSAGIVVLGGLLLSTQLLPLVALVTGYLVRVLRSGGDSDLPVFDHWRSLLGDGFRVIVVWVSYILWPVLLLLAGQEVLLPRGVEVGSLGVANFVVGLLAVSIGPPVAYDFDRVIRDILTYLDLASLSNNPYLVRDVTTVATSTWMLFAVGLLIALYLIPAAIYRVGTAGNSESSLWAGFNLPAVFHLVSRTTYATKWVRAMTIWMVGSGTVIGWHVWRRHQRYTGGPPDTILTETELIDAVLPDWISPELALPVPTINGILSTIFLLVSSTVCFYCLVAGYKVVRKGCERPETIQHDGE